MTVTNEDLPRLAELADRLTMSGGKAAHVSMSELHEVAEGLHDLIVEWRRVHGPHTPDDPARPHIVGGKFQSDKYPTCPAGKVPLSVTDPTTQDLLWQYAQRRRAVDAQFADDLELALRAAGSTDPTPITTAFIDTWADKITRDDEADVSMTGVRRVLREMFIAAGHIVEEPST